MATQEQIDFWNGPAAERWIKFAPHLDHALEPLGRAAMDAAPIRAGLRVVDVGCGTGATSLELSERVGPSGKVLGLDLSAPMLAVARAKLAGRAHARFEACDASTYALEEGAWDVLFSRFGVMFFADPVAAFANMRRAMKPSGRLVFLCWRTPAENPWATVPMRAAQPFLPPVARPGPEDPGQYSFGDRNRVERILTQAGFKDLSIAPVDQMLDQGTDIPDVVQRIGDFGPLARLFREATPEQVGKAKAAVAEALKPHATADGVKLAGACWLVRARP